MRWTLAWAAMLPVLAAGSTAAGAAVSLAFIDPSGYADGRLEARFGRTADPFVERELRGLFEGLGARCLPAGRNLRIEILDIDLAGRVAIARAPGENLRVLTEATWPRIRLRWTLEEGGAATASGAEWIADRAYLTRIGRGDAGDPLRYEKRMLTEWFRTRFGAGTGAE